MKKALSLIIVLAIALSACAFASADNNNMTISYTAAQAYVLTIPATTSLNADQEISLSSVLLEANNEFAVQMTSAHDFRLTCGESEIPYKVSVGEVEKLNNNSVVLIVKAGDKTGSATLSFSASDEDIASATYAGAHTDTLSFEVQSFLGGTCEVGYEAGAEIS